MSLVFPASPTVGDTYTVGARTWTWSGTIWEITGTVAAAGSIGTTELADSAITTAKIAAGAVAEADIADGAVTTAKIATGAVVEADIASNAVTAGKLGTDVRLGYRNVIINGAMQIAQRGTSTTSKTSGGYATVDRFNAVISGLGTWTETVENDAPTGSGFRKSWKLLCTTADASPGASDYFVAYQLVEGQNCQQFAKGTASAKQFALSFWVKGSTTGTYVVELYDNDNGRSISSSYTISVAGTWEKKTLIFSADTSGVFDNDSNASLAIQWWLGAGTTFTSGTLATTWGTNASANRAAGTTNVAGATNRYWQVTGVQLEAGAVATPFEFEDFGTTLAKCLRYYFRVGMDSIYSRLGFGQFSSATVGRGMVQAPITLRAVPSSIEYASLGTYDQVNLQPISSLTLSTQGSSRNMVQFDVAISANGSQYRWFEIVANTTASAYFGASAEL